MFNTAKQQVLYGVKADRAHLKRLLYRGMQGRQMEGVEQPRDLDVFASAMPVHASFHQPAQRCELLGKLPTLQRRGLIKCVELLLQQRQVVDRVEDEFIAIPAPGMAGNDFAPTANHHVMDISPDPDILMGKGDRHRVVIGLVAHERLRRDAAGVLIAGVKG